MPLSVLFTIASLHPEHGGPSRSVPALAAAVSVAGANVSLLSCEMGEGYREPVFPAQGNVTTHLASCSGPLSRRIRYTRKFGAALREQCEEQGVQVIHDTGIWLPTNHSAAAAARKLRLPLVISPRGMLSAWSLGYRGWKKKLAWRLFQKRDLETASLLHATSLQEAQEFRAIGLRQPIAIVGNVVNLPPEKTARASPDRRSRTVLFLSRIHPKKGILDLLKAWGRLRPEGWRLRIVGGGELEHREEVGREIAKLDLEGIVSVKTQVDDREKWIEYGKADLFVLPSYSENFGIVIAEALAAGLPVITTRETPWEDLLLRKCGWWVETGAAALEAVLGAAVLVSDNERTAMGVRGRALVEEKYSSASVGQQMLEAYQWLAVAGPKPSHII